MLRSALLWIVLTACSSSHEQPDAAPPGGPIQLDDVTVVFPLSPQLLGASALLPEGIYDAAGHIAGSSGHPPPGGTGEALYKDLRVVAMRIDPCFASLAPDPHGNGCTNQLRLVFQEVKDGSGAFDSALHAFYELSREDLVALAQSIASLRAANSSGERLGALGPHPIMVAQGPDGAMAKGVRALIQKYASASNLVRITELSMSNGGFDWSFSGFDLAGMTLTPIAIPTLGASTTKQTFFRGFGQQLQGSFSPATTSSDNLVPLANVDTAQTLTADARAAAFAGLVHIENPTRASPNTIDCASCHLATPVTRLVAQPMFGLDDRSAPDAFAADGTFVLASELTATFPSATFNVHACSYVDGDLAINQRTVNESAAIVAYLNAL